MKEKHDKEKSESKLVYGKPKNAWDIRPFMPTILALLFLIVVSLIIFFIFFRYQGLASAISELFSILQAIFIGLVIAYLVNPIMKFFERRLVRRSKKRGRELTMKNHRRIRGLAVLGGMLVFVGIIGLLLVLIIPQVIVSVQDLVDNLTSLVEDLRATISSLTRAPSTPPWVATVVDSVVEYIQTWLEKNVLSGESKILSTITESVFTVVKTLFNIILGLMAAVYMLMRKENFIGQVKKLIYGIFRPRAGNAIMDVIRKADDVFGGFLIGDIIDALIIGFICLAGMLIMKMPYPVLIAVFVGITNLIPVYGPYIGAIPSALLILMVNPIQALYFLIFIVVIQQIDGNFLKPKILGNSLDLSPYWILFAIIFFGGIGGVMGMLLGVPIFAMIYYIVKRIVEHILRVRNLPIETDEYIMVDHVDPKTYEVVEHPKNVRTHVVYWYRDENGELLKKIKVTRKK